MHSPDPHQRKALRNIAKHFATGADRGQILMACGTGKTLVSAWGAQRIGARRTVFLSPSIHVSWQASKEWAGVGVAPTALVCSDKEVDKNIPVTTQTNEIAAILRDRDTWAIFGTYASADRIGAALHALGLAADLLVCDEAHHLAGHDGKKYALVLDDTGLPATRRLFFTATPRVNTRNDDRVTGMDDASVFGLVVYRLTFGQAIRARLLPDYVLMCVAIPEGTNLESQEEAEAAVHAAILRAKRDGHLGPTILFRQTRERGRASVEFFEGAGITSRLVDWTQRIREREAAIKAVVANNGIIVTVDAVGEGVNVPAFSTAGFIDPRQSITKIVQNVSRALRRDRENRAKITTIIVPYVARGGEATELNGTLGRTIAALREHDDRMEDKIGAAIGESAGGRALTPAEERWLDVHGLRDVLRGPAGAAVLQEVAGEYEWAWWSMFALLLAFVEREGHAQVPTDHVEAGRRLGAWVGMRRARRGLQPARDARLEQVRDWAWSVFDVAWRRRFDPYAAWVATNGRHPRAKGVGLSDEERRHGEWGANQRRIHGRGQLSEWRVAMLAAVSGWEWEKTRALTTEGREKMVQAQRQRHAGWRLSVLSMIGPDWTNLSQIAKERGTPMPKELLRSLLREALVECKTGRQLGRGKGREPYLYRRTAAGEAALRDA